MQDYRSAYNNIRDWLRRQREGRVPEQSSVIEAFFTFAQAEQLREAQELISLENLNADAAKRYIF